MIIPLISLKSYDDIRRRWWYPQKTVAICAENIGNVFWVQNILTGLCSSCVATTDPWLAFFHCISKLFDGYQTILETPQNLLTKPQNFRRSLLQNFLRNHQIFFRILILRLFEDLQNFLMILIIFWGSSESSEDGHPQKFLKIVRILRRSSELTEDPIFRIFWRSPSSEFSIFSEDLQKFVRIYPEFSEDRHPQNFSRSSTSEFWGSSSWEFSEDRHPQNFLRILRILWGLHPQNFLWIVILRIFWGSSSSEFSEGPHLQNFEKIVILRIFWRSAEFSLGNQLVLTWWFWLVVWKSGNWWFCELRKKQNIKPCKQWNRWK